MQKGFSNETLQIYFKSSDQSAYSSDPRTTRNQRGAEKSKDPINQKTSSENFMFFPEP